MNAVRVFKKPHALCNWVGGEVGGEVPSVKKKKKEEEDCTVML